MASGEEDAPLLLALDDASPCTLLDVLAVGGIAPHLSELIDPSALAALASCSKECAAQLSDGRLWASLLAPLASGAVSVLAGASGAVAALIQAMNMGYHEEEKRSFIKLNALTLTFTFCGILFVVMSIIAIAAAPPILKALSLGSFVEAAINSVRWLVIIALFMAACAAIYRSTLRRWARKFRPGSITRATWKRPPRPLIARFLRYRPSRRILCDGVIRLAPLRRESHLC
jgi:hypothetical protein